MPRETFYPASNDEPDCRVEVRWSKERFLQVGTTKHFVDPCADVSSQEWWEGQWVDLDRQTINDLIRVLRRARDQAFGRDE